MIKDDKMVQHLHGSSNFPSELKRDMLGNIPFMPISTFFYYLL